MTCDNCKVRELCMEMRRNSDYFEAECYLDDCDEENPLDEYCVSCGRYLAAGEFSPTVPSLCNRCNSR